MNNLDDLKKKLQEAQTLVEKLQAEVEIAQKAPKWEPKGGNYVVGVCGADFITYRSHYLVDSYGLAFKTKEAADKAYKDYRAYHRLYKLAEELNEGWEPDWNEPIQPKYYIVSGSGKLSVTNSNWIMSFGSVYFKSEEAAKKAIEIIKNGGLE